MRALQLQVGFFSSSLSFSVSSAATVPLVPFQFSNEFYRLLLEEEWTPKKWNGPLQYENSKSGADLMMLPADLALVKDPRFRRYVEAYAADEQLFFRDFARAFEKLLELGVDFSKKRQVVLK